MHIIEKYAVTDVFPLELKTHAHIGTDIWQILCDELGVRRLFDLTELHDIRQPTWNAQLYGCEKLRT